MAVNTVGTKLLVGSDTVTEVTGISGVGMTAEAFDSTDLLDSYKTFVSKGLVEINEFTMNGFFEPNDTTGQKVLWDALRAGTSLAMTVVYPNVNAEFGGNGLITAFSIDSEVDGDGIGFEATVRTSGQWDLSLEASGGLTALSLTGAGGTLSPAFSAGELSYTFYDVTASSFTVTPTAASHTIQLFVDGVFVENVTSGAASSAITISAGAAKKVTLIAFESGKTRQVTDIIVTGA